MTISIYKASVPVFRQMLSALADVLAKAQVQAKEHKLDIDMLLESRLIEDMFPLLKQVQIATDFAKSVPARLAGVDVPVFDDSEQSIEELQERIAKTIAFLDSLDPARFEGSGQREILLRPGTPKERKLSGEAYLLSYGLPQFFFHVATAYGLLRHNGIAIGKRDYMGAY